MEDNNDELEIFRRQWREEVSARTKSSSLSQPKLQQRSVTSEVDPSRGLYRYGAADVGEKGDKVEAEKGLALQRHGDLGADVRSLSLARGEEDLFLPEPANEPSSALEHFEQAVRKEAQGSLGDSLNLYRKAYKVTHLAA
jgi:F-box protein 9